MNNDVQVVRDVLGKMQGMIAVGDDGPNGHEVLTAIAALTRLAPVEVVDFVFDEINGSPDLKFVETEMEGCGVKVGEWISFLGKRHVLRVKIEVNKV